MACHVQCGDDRDVFLSENKEYGVRKSPQQRAARFISYTNEPARCPLNLRNATRHLVDKSLAKAGLLGFVPDVAFGNVRLRFGPDNQPYTRPA